MLKTLDFACNESGFLTGRDFFGKVGHRAKMLCWYQAETLRRKLWAFAAATKTRKRLSLVLLTTFGLHPNIHSSGLVEEVLTLDALFWE